MKNLISIYNTFKSKNINKEKETLNDIVKGTKSVLANKLKFKEYIRNYSRTTERYAFKSPGITEYPLFKKQSCILIPVKRKKIKFYEDIKSEKNEEKAIRPKQLFLGSAKESLYKKKLLFNINHLDTSKRIFQNKLYRLHSNRTLHETERYNSLFLDFFHKWTKDQINPSFMENSKNNFSARDYINCQRDSDNNTKDIKNNNFSELKYDDNKIFNHDYTKFINEKMEYIKNNNIENSQKKLETVFNEANGKEIRLKLESVKIIFQPISNVSNSNKIRKINSYSFMNSKEQENENNIVIYIPLYYAFLICYKKFELFKQILVSSIIFSDNFETISFSDKLIKLILKEYLNKNVNENSTRNKSKEYSCNSKKNIKPPTMTITPKKIGPFRKLATKNYNNFTSTFGEKKSNNGSTFNMLRSSFIEKAEKKQKKEEIIHSNKIRNRNSFYNMHSCDSTKAYDKNHLHNKEKENNNYTNNYNEYIFLWETNPKTFLVTVQMPTIHFKYKSVRNEIIAFCDKNLFLYIYKNNFINWDFYVLNFLFSIKAFRKIILNNYSINRTLNYTDVYSKTISIDNSSFKKNTTMKNNKDILNSNIDTKEIKKYDFLTEAIIINKNENKIYNILNESNETYLFFYTDNFYNNSIIKMFSYLIVIDYEKLNPKIKWKYYLDFKQMNQLNEITKYESLDSFLPKIIKTDFQNGILSMDFSLFNEFNIEVLGYEKKNIINGNKIRNKSISQANTVANPPTSKELCIDIQYPCVKVTKVVKSNDDIFFVTNKVDLDINFLQKINNYKINSWSQKILEILNPVDENINSSSTNLSPQMSSQTINKNKNIKVMSLGNSLTKSISNPRRFLKSISFNSIPITSKFHPKS